MISAADPGSMTSELLDATPTKARAVGLGALKTLGTTAAVATAGLLLAHDYVGTIVGALVAIGSLAAYERL